MRGSTVVKRREEVQASTGETGRENALNEWLTLSEVCEITSMAVSSLRDLVERNRIKRVKEVNGKGFSYLVIHRDEIKKLQETGEQGQFQSDSDPEQTTGGKTIPVEYHDRKMQEWKLERDQFVQGIMMYRYKYEDLERKMKLLPAPPEKINEELRHKEALLMKAKKIISRDQAYMKQMTTGLDVRNSAFAKARKVIEKERLMRVDILSSLREKEARLAEKVHLLDEAQRILRDEVAARNRITAEMHQKEESIASLQNRLEEEKAAKQELHRKWEKMIADAQKPWWKKLLGI